MKFSNYCKSVQDDLLLGTTLESRSYKLLKYEDLISNPLTETESLYKFMGVKFTPEIEKEVHKHFNSDGKTNKKFMGTFKSADFVEKKKKTSMLDPNLVL